MTDVYPLIKRFQTTRYQGSKRKLLSWIHGIIKDLPFETVLDGFGGTASVSFLLKSMGKKVTYNDYLKFNSIIALSIIENSSIRLLDSEIDEILHNESLGNNFINRIFENLYYLDYENNWIERIITGINNFETNSFYETEFKKAIAFNALFQSCIIKRPYNLFHRKNLYMRTNNVERSFGNKKTWDRDFDDFFIKFVHEINTAIFCSDVNCTVLNKDIFEINESYDLVYLDPPYVLKNSKNESSNYLNCYHFLEGITDYDSWLDRIDFTTRIRRLNNPDLKNYFKVSTVHDTFSRLINKFQKSIIVISYKYGGIPTIDFIVDLLKKNGKKIKTYSLPYSYALNKQNGNAILNREYLIIGI